ncbi:ABC transporter permease, partial [Intestinibacter sp.]|uniref:ABC transporter permease n=1 Tax=Intestinibacter sp. TaxID=1965304 RepID=UPI003F18758D
MSNERMPRPRRRGHGPMGKMMPGEKAKDFKGTMKKLMAYLGKYIYAIIAVFIFAVGSVAFSVIGPKVLGKATTEIFNGLVGKISGGDGIDFDKIKMILLFLVALYVVSTILSFIQGFIMSGISQKVAYNLRDELCKKINRLPMGYFDKTTNGEVLSRFTNDIDTLAQTLNQSLTQLVTAVTTLVGVLVMMISISGLMTFSALVIIPLGMLVISRIIKRSQKFFKQQQEYLGNVNGQVEELYGGHLVVQAFNGEEDAIERFNETNEKLYQSAWKSQFLSGMMQPLMNFVGNLGYVLISILGGFLVIKNSIEVGDI